MASQLHVLCVNAPRLLKHFPLWHMLAQTESYHTVHSKVAVLCLQLHCMRVAGPNLSVAVQK